MKKLVFPLLLMLCALACKKPAVVSSEPADEAQAITRRQCAANDVLEAQMAADPGRRQRLEQIEAFTRNAIRSGLVAKKTGTTIEIPVVVHVLYNTPEQNISDAQVQSQLDVLNEDYQDRNADGKQLPANSFQAVVSSGMNVHFVLAQPPVHAYTKMKSFGANDAMKFTNRGGDDAVDPATKLNMWSCNLGHGLLGYAQFPGGQPGTDGVVILYSAFGSRAKYAAGTYVAKYDLGRTATHEVGHWMNLRHIWGDDNGACTGSDLVDDTPNQASENYGCPAFPHVSCNNGPTGDMFMNYMDYTDDACMYLFSAGQKDRALAVFATGGPRQAFAN